MSKNRTKLLKKEPRKMENQRKNDKKKDERRDNKKDPSYNDDSWSDHPETQFEPTYPFFRNLEPKPTLHT